MDFSDYSVPTELDFGWAVSWTFLRSLIPPDILSSWESLDFLKARYALTLGLRLSSERAGAKRCVILDIYYTFLYSVNRYTRQIRVQIRGNLRGQNRYLQSQGKQKSLSKVSFDIFGLSVGS